MKYASLSIVYWLFSKKCTIFLYDAMLYFAFIIVSFLRHHAFLRVVVFNFDCLYDNRSDWLNQLNQPFKITDLPCFSLGIKFSFILLLCKRFALYIHVIYIHKIYSWMYLAQAFNVKFDFNTFYGLHIPKPSFLTQKGAQKFLENSFHWIQTKLVLFHFNLNMTKKE